MNKVELTVDGKPVTANAGTSVLTAALANDIYIPHLCHHPELPGQGTCRLCMVEIEGRGMVTACRMAVEPEMKVTTKSPEIDRAVRPVAELLVANHHISCRGCPSNRKCQLQTLMAKLKIAKRRVRRLRLPDSQRPLDTSGPCFDYDADKCILCGICIETCRALHEDSLLRFMNRGSETVVAFFGDRSNCETCLECVRRCPVGVLLPK